MKLTNNILKIVISGPESSGKSTTAKWLAKEFNTIYIPEYAREYSEKKKNNCSFNDIITIARQQISELEKNYKDAHKFVFFDTGLIITKVWFEVAHNKVPIFLTEAIKSIKIDLCLLSYPDIDWVADSVRVNSGNKRFELFTKYRQELERYKIKYKIIKGTGEERFLNAKKIITSAYCL